MKDTLQFILEKNNLTLGGQIIEIPNVSRFDLIKWLKELDFKTGVEVGVAHAEYSKFIAYLNPQMKVCGVDPYVGYKEYKDYVKEITFRGIHLEAQARMRPYNNYKFIEKFSMEAVKDFEDNFLDFVYIYANHQDPYITQDIVEWTKKVRSGGIVAGHDYVKLKHTRVDVIKAVNKYVKEKNLALFILGSSARNTGEMRERVRSWMFIKK